MMNTSLPVMEQLRRLNQNLLAPQGPATPP